jgi:hypothetical protein
LVGVLKCRTQFWKRFTQESFQQSLVEIGSVVSEEKIFFKFHPPLPILELLPFFHQIMCPVIPTSNQDGHQAKNRKKGGGQSREIGNIGYIILDQVTAKHKTR